MATWKETSVLGEQCDGVGCFGGWWVGRGCSGGQRIRRVERAAGAHSMPTQGDRGIASLATATTAPLELGLNVRGTGTEWAAVTQ